MSQFHAVVGRRSYPISTWLEMFETEIDTGEEVQLWHTVKPRDYVTALVETKDHKIALVQQMRAVGATVTTEFPGGLLEQHESPEDCIRREILEEVGLKIGELHFLADMIPDTGRLENRLYAFYASNCEFVEEVIVEPGIVPLFVEKEEFLSLLKAGQVVSAINIAILGHALVQKLFSF